MRATYPSLRGRTALVTGGASGIGAAIVAGFVRNGAAVGLLDREEAAGAATARATGALFVPCDLLDIDALRAAVAMVAARLGPIRALVNNAANDQRHDPDRVEPEDWDFSLNVNLRHHFFAAQAVRGGMRDAGGGAIVNISSVAWHFGAPEMVPYTAAKAGVEGLTRSLGVAFGPDGIRVNAIAPGAVMTPRQMQMWHTEETKARLVGQQAIRADVTEEDIADACLFLCSDDADRITKQCLVVDGGLR